MSLYYSIADPLDVRDIANLYAMWVEIGNPKADLWAEQPPEPAHDPATQHAPEWADGAWVVRDLTEGELAAIARTSSRSSLRTIWDNLPAYIRGPYRPQFEAANRLLDEGDDVGAADLIQYATPCPSYDQWQFDAFESVKSTLLAGIESLPAITQP